MLDSGIQKDIARRAIDFEIFLEHILALTGSEDQVSPAMRTLNFYGKALHGPSGCRGSGAVMSSPLRASMTPAVDKSGSRRLILTDFLMHFLQLTFMEEKFHFGLTMRD